MSIGPIPARLVTVSASYGAGGSVVAPALAARLGVPFLPRATSSEAASRDRAVRRAADAGRGQDDAGAPAARCAHAGDAGRAHPVTAVGPPSGRGPAPPRRGRRPPPGGRRRGVILGRGAAVVLGKDRGSTSGLTGRPTGASCRAPRSRGIEGEAQASPGRGRPGPRRLRPPPVPRRPGRSAPLPPGHRLHRDPARRRRRDDPGRRPRPQRRAARHGTDRDGSWAFRACATRNPLHSAALEPPCH